MRKFFLPLFYAFMLVGCNKHSLGPTNLFLENKELTQLKGRHILDMEKYTGGWSYIDIGMFSNKYYLQYDPREVLSVERSCNFWGCSVVGVNYSTYGYIYFTTDKDGYITDYTEDGDAIRSVKHKFKDLLVLEN
ncbi:hypothetical protein [uncultured Campylobacter sp.]|uniref:hypothetical protein n=1 Tax=uncultured Campylobacter sp. TaxID=218934 RepID=UPI002601F461|nr:hypothetical protein [uncultured Campylobacter sp.]